MELKEGMYVRYKYHNEQKIGKVDFIIYNEFADENFIGLTNNEGIFEGKILKASFNIIDLIEVGDYVNSTFVLDFETLATGEKAVIVDGLITYGWGQGVIPVGKINDIVTKEQFNSMKYVVERDK